MGKIQNLTTFHHVQPILGVLKGSEENQSAGSTVYIIATADVEGKSPAYLCVDSLGQSAWQSFSNVAIADLRFVPPTTERLAEMTNQLQTTSSSSRR